MRLLFVSNLYPDREDTVRGQDNARLLHALAGDCEAVRVLALRPTLSPARLCGRPRWRPREEDEGFHPVYKGVPYVPKFGSAWNHRLMARSIARPLEAIRRRFPYDRILVSWLFPDGCAVARLATVPFTMICQGSDAHAYLSDPTRRRLIVAATRKSNGVITRSADLAGRLASAGAPEEKLHPVYNGVDLDVFHPAADKTAAREELGLAAGAKWVLFVGNLLPVKNPSLLLRAVAAVRRAPGAPDARLVMVGAGPLEQAVKSEAQQLGLADSLVLPGSLPARRVADYMRAADLLCLSSHNEGVPNVLLEAFASGLPVVATDVGGIAELLDRPELGALVPGDDAPALAEALRAQLQSPLAPGPIREHSIQFSWNSTSAKYLQILSQAGRVDD